MAGFSGSWHSSAPSSAQLCAQTVQCTVSYVNTLQDCCCTLGDETSEQCAHIGGRGTRNNVHMEEAGAVAVAKTKLSDISHSEYLVSELGSKQNTL